MIYFIPSWHQKNSWSENEQFWYRRREKTEFDDTVKQVQLFHRSGAFPYEIILLSYAPNFRHFLHRQGVFRASYWSCFDAIQEITTMRQAVFSYRDLEWPEDCEFVYTPFVIAVYRQNEKYAQIEFGEDGNLIQVDIYKDNKVYKKMIYDDRGFISSVIYHNDGKPIYQEYRTEKGNWKIRHYFEDGSVVVNPDTPNYIIKNKDEYSEYKFTRSRYTDISLLIEEVMSSYVRILDYSSEQSIFCVAADNYMAEAEYNVLKDRSIILSFFENRCENQISEYLNKIISKAKYVIADSEDNYNALIHRIPKNISIRDITPYDSRIDEGISQQLKVQKILVPMDGVDENDYKSLIKQLGIYLKSNSRAMVHLFSRRADYWLEEELLDKTKKVLAEFGYPREWASKQNNNYIAENNIDQEEETEDLRQRFFVEQCVDEMSVNRCIREQRIVLDIRKQAELYLQITALSVGIPQLVRTNTRYVEDKKNGDILDSSAEIVGLLEKYLDNLKYWNESKIYSYEISQRYSTQVLIKMWTEVIDSIG